MIETDVLIIGSGPAGSATALALVLEPEVADATALLRAALTKILRREP